MFDECSVRLTIDIQIMGGERNVGKHMDEFQGAARPAVTSTASGPATSAAVGNQQAEQQAYVPKEPVTNRLRKKEEQWRNAVLVSGTIRE